MQKLKIVVAIIALFVSFQLAATVPNNNGNKPEQEKSETAVIKMTKADFLAKVMDYEKNPTEWVFKGDKPCVIDFYADWCGPCRMLAPVLEELQTEYAGKLQIYKVDTQKERQLSGALGIQSLPTVLFIPKEGKPQALLGFRSKEDLEKIIADFLKVK